MSVKNLRPYEISLWTLQDAFISVLKPLDNLQAGQIETPKCSIKDDGTQELTFSIPAYFHQNGELTENPIWYNTLNGNLIVNMRKLKLIFNKGENGEQVFEFVINKVEETHKDGQLYSDVSAEGLAFQELGKIGYKISLLSQDYIDEYEEWVENGKEGQEPINNINYWCDKIFSNSNWKYEIKMNWCGFDGVIEPLTNEERTTRGLRRTDTIYEEEYVSAWQDKNGILVPYQAESFKEKLRLVELEKSNIYNLTQNLAETFGVYCRYEYEYDEYYHIIGRKVIFYNNFLLEEQGSFDITYPYDAEEIKREIDSNDITTKMFVVALEDDNTSSGLITIADVSANRSREDYILNFDYLYEIGTITQEQYDEVQVYERSMYLINNELDPISSQIANLQEDLVEYQAQLTYARESQTLDKEQMEQANALLNAVSKGTGFLYKSADTPYRGVLLQREGESNYYVKITQEGVDTTGKKGYPLHEGEDNSYGIRIFYNVKGDSGNILTLYTDNETAPSTDKKVAIFPSSVKIEYDDCGNVVALSNIKLVDNAISKNYYITFAYTPELQYQNIYNTYAKKLADDEVKEKEATTQITAIEEKLSKLRERNEELLNEKAKTIAEFENMMGPAIKEGSWQADNYTDYGTKYEENVSCVDTVNHAHINFKWDTEAFDEEQKVYYEEGTELTKVQYPCIDLTGLLPNIKDNLTNLSFVYRENDRLPKDNFKEMTIGAEAQFAFVRANAEVKPILLLLDTSFDKTQAEKYYIALIHSSLNDDGTVSGTTETLIPQGKVVWLDTTEYTTVYPRLEVNSLFLKTSEDELIISTEGELLEKFYDYSVLPRDTSYFITLKPEVMLRNANLQKVFEINYALSNAAEALYLDALEVSKENAYPQVSYEVSVSAYNEDFIKYDYSYLNRIVKINDTDLKFNEVQGYISEIELRLDKPWEDTIKIQNYRTKFEDLFSTIVASSEQMKTNSFAYNTAANAFNSNGTIKNNILQTTISQTDLTYAFQSGNLTIDEVNGIWARSDAGVVAIRGGGIFCATQIDSNGNWLWNTGIMPSGINASLLTAGQIDTNLIKIYAGDNLRLQLNSDGLFAYQQNESGEANLSRYIVHNSDGLFSTIENANGNKTNLVEVSWDGFILRNDKGKTVFSADREGNLSIVGNITANTGKIGEWLISDGGLITEDSRAGLLAKTGEDNRMFWVVGTQNDDGTVNEFAVNADGTMYCSNAIVRGFISSGSYIGNTSSEEIDKQLRTITVSVLDGSTFIFDNRNYDNNLFVSPDTLYFRIKTNALTTEELTEEGADTALTGYSFFWGTEENGEEWSLIESEEYIIWEPNYLTFRVKSDIMYLAAEDPSKPAVSLYLKVKKKGKKRNVNEKGEVSITEAYEYEDVVHLTAELHGVGKYVSPVDPPSYSFIEDKNNEIAFVDNTTFSVSLSGFTLEEASTSRWLINGGEEVYPYAVIGTKTKSFNTQTGTALLVSDDEGIDIQDNTTLIGATENEEAGVEIFLEEQEDETILAKLVIANEKIPLGGSAAITFQIDTATRTAYCFRNKNGADGINIILRSTSGSTLVSGDTETELSAEVYYGTQLMNGETELFYVWKQDDVALSTLVQTETKMEDQEDGDIIQTQIKHTYTSADEVFFTLDRILITAEDFGVKSNYSCYVFSTKEEAQAEYNLMNENGE